MISRRYQQMYQNEMQHWWYFGRRVLLNKLLEKFTSNKKIRLLDVGCGTGSTLYLLRRFGDAYGVDNNSNAIKYCQLRGFKQVKYASITMLPFPSNSFDVVTCLDVLEHVEDESIALSEIRRTLKEHGVLIIFVPAFQLLWSDLDRQSHHLRRYSYADLEIVLKKNGFIIKKGNYYNHILFIPILLIRLIQRYLSGKRPAFGIDPRTPNNLINMLLKRLFLLDIHSTFWLNPPFGVSIYVVCLKR